MNTEPTMMVPPATLYHDDRFTVWHSGLVLGPPGLIALGLEIVSVDELTFQVEAWRQDSPPPVHAYIEMPGSGPVDGSSDRFNDRYVFHYRQWFPGQRREVGQFQPLDRDQLVGAQMHIDVHPLGQHFVINLDPQ